MAPTGHRIGYVRVSSIDQNPERLWGTNEAATHVWVAASRRC